ncbi:hypothetical protein VQ056_07180 [Paenibacillus sp. JTLBN-2024]
MTVKAMSGMMMTSDASLKAVPKVSELQAIGGNGSVALSWKAVPEAASYRIYRAPIEGGTLEQAATVNGTDWTDTNVQNGTKYYYARDGGHAGWGERFERLRIRYAFYPVQSVEITGTSTPVTLGAGHKTSPIQVTIHVPGLSDHPAYAGKEMPGVAAKLAFYKEGDNKEDAGETKLRYSEDTPDGRKVYWAAFEPTEAGTFHYFAKVSTDNGQTYTESASANVDVYADPVNTTPPEAPVLASIGTESSRAQLAWTHAGGAFKFEVYRKQDGGISKSWPSSMLRRRATRILR